MPSDIRVEYPRPTEKEQHEFALFLLFGPRATNAPRMACVANAYLDLCRTLHGVAKLANLVELRESAHHRVDSLLGSLANSSNISKQDDFDSWHSDACADLKQHYSSNNFTKFTIGQGAEVDQHGAQVCLCFRRGAHSRL
jgi:hypothetical protein